MGAPTWPSGRLETHAQLSVARICSPCKIVVHRQHAAVDICHCCCRLHAQASQSMLLVACVTLVWLVSCLPSCDLLSSVQIYRAAVPGAFATVLCVPCLVLYVLPVYRLGMRAWNGCPQAWVQLTFQPQLPTHGADYKRARPPCVSLATGVEETYLCYGHSSRGNSHHRAALQLLPLFLRSTSLGSAGIEWVNNTCYIVGCGLWLWRWCAVLALWEGISAQSLDVATQCDREAIGHLLPPHAHAGRDPMPPWLRVYSA